MPLNLFQVSVRVRDNTDKANISVMMVEEVLNLFREEVAAFR